MFPGMNPKQLEQAMKKMGIKQEEIPASEVIIRSEGRDLVIASPKVVRVNMMGQDSFQVTGSVEERSASMEISEYDVQTVARQANVSGERAREALEEVDGDLAAAILRLKQ